MTDEIDEFNQLLGRLRDVVDLLRHQFESIRNPNLNNHQNQHRLIEKFQLKMSILSEQLLVLEDHAADQVGLDGVDALTQVSVELIAVQVVQFQVSERFQQLQR